MQIFFQVSLKASIKVFFVFLCALKLLWILLIFFKAFEIKNFLYHFFYKLYINKAQDISKKKMPLSETLWYPLTSHNQPSSSKASNHWTPSSITRSDHSDTVVLFISSPPYPGNFFFQITIATAGVVKWSENMACNMQKRIEKLQCNKIVTA